VDVFPWNRFELGNRSTIESYAAISNGVGDLIIGDNVRIGIGSVVLGPVIMGSGSGLGHNVFVSGFSHGYEDGTLNSSVQPLVVKGTVIGEDAHIGANSVVVPGVRIGKRCQIGAGSVVTTDIPAFSIAVGNPARVIKVYDENLREWRRV
jgi:acetyltransferase-like isoleucine patch superfamily enzyme